MPRVQRWCFCCVLLFSTTLVPMENIKLARPKRQDMCRRNGWSGFTYFENGAYFRAQERGVGWSCRLGVDVFFRCSMKTMQILAYLHNFLSFSSPQRLINTVVSNVTCFQWRVFGGVVFAQDRSALLEHKKPQGSRGWLDRCLYMDLSIGDPLLATPKWPAKSFNWGLVKPSYSFLRQILQRCRPKQFLWMTSFERNELSCDHRLKYTW